MFNLTNFMSRPKIVNTFNAQQTWNVTSDSNYYYYTFDAASSTNGSYKTHLFEVRGTLIADIILIGAGGGGAGGSSTGGPGSASLAGGGGGAGQVVLTSNVKLRQGLYTGNVAQGGAGGAFNGGAGGTPYLKTTLTDATLSLNLTAYSGTPAPGGSGNTVLTGGNCHQNSIIYSGGTGTAYVNYYWYGASAGGAGSAGNGTNPSNTSGSYIPGNGGAGTTIWGNTYAAGGNGNWLNTGAYTSAESTYGCGGRGARYGQPYTGYPGKGGAIIIRTRR